MRFDHSKYSFKKKYVMEHALFSIQADAVKVHIKICARFYVNVLLGVYWFPQSYW